jgi:hypothetical protein
VVRSVCHITAVLLPALHVATLLWDTSASHKATLPLPLPRFHLCVTAPTILWPSALPAWPSEDGVNPDGAELTLATRCVRKHRECISCSSPATAAAEETSRAGDGAGAVSGDGE